MNISTKRYYLTQSICMMFGASIMAIIFIHPIFIMFLIIFTIAYLWVTA